MDPGEIDTVIYSHLHFDHVVCSVHHSGRGGLTHERYLRVTCETFRMLASSLVLVVHRKVIQAGLRRKALSCLTHWSHHREKSESCHTRTTNGKHGDHFQRQWTSLVMVVFCWSTCQVTWQVISVLSGGLDQTSRSDHD